MHLQLVLARLGITCYWQLLFEAGFETWEVLQDITERDMQAINMKLGHRRRLQREIATARGHPTNAALDQSVICCCIAAGSQACIMRVERIAQYLQGPTGSCIGQIHATNSSSDFALGGSVITDGFPWDLDFISPGI